MRRERTGSKRKRIYWLRYLLILATVIGFHSAVQKNINNLQKNSNHQQQDHRSQTDNNSHVRHDVMKNQGKLTHKFGLLSSNCHEDDFPGTFTRRNSSIGLYSSANQRGFLIESQNQLENALTLKVSLTGTNTINFRNDPAVCEFQTTPLTHHFTHGMEQLYRCISWWQQLQTKNSSSPLRPVLVWPRSQEIRQHFFYTDLFKVLQKEFKVAILPSTPGNKSVRQDLKYRDDHQKFAPFGLLNPDHAQRFTRAVLDYANQTQLLENAWHQRRMEKRPRISILNRHVSHGRSVLNVDQLQEQLIRSSLDPQQQQLQLSSASPPYFTVAPVTYFENASFLEQFAFFASVDIVLSPHGAQLTSLVALPPCGSVLELFPKHYWIPDYFGTLATGADKAHAYFHPGPSHVHSRQMRYNNLCPSLDAVRDGIWQLVDDWRQCITAMTT